MVEVLWSITLVVIAAVIAIKVWPLRRVVIYEYQRGLKYRRGRFQETLGPGIHWVFPPTSAIVAIDIRPSLVTIPSQEVISADGVSLKLSLAAEFEVADPATAINKNAAYLQSFYLVLQMAIRQIVGSEKMEALVEQRASLSARIAELTKTKIESLGIRLISAEMKDVMLPGELRRTFAQVVKAQKEGQAAMERARGETAALRSLANAAKMIEENPNLLQLRALQTMAESTGNTIMLGVNAAPVSPVSDKNGK